MRKLASIIIAVIITHSFLAQNATIAKFKFEEAEDAFEQEDYTTALSKLAEAEKLFGKSNPPINYLRIMAQSNLLTEEVLRNPELILDLQKNCKFYLKEYANMDAVQDKYKEVYYVSDYIKIYPDNLESYKAYSYMVNFNDTTLVYKKGCEIATKLTNNGDDFGMYLLGRLHFLGNGVNKDCLKGMEWFKKSSEKGNVYAKEMLAWIYKGNLDKRYCYVNNDPAIAFKYWQEAADRGYPPALEKMGDYYFFGEEVPQNDNEAFKYYSLAARRKNSGAMGQLGYLYLNGKGVVENKRTSLEWFQKGGEKGDCFSMFKLGTIYSNGNQGETVNTEKGLDWLMKSKDCDSRANPYIAEIYMEKKQYQEALKYYEIAANQGNSESMYDLGNLYFDGSYNGGRTPYFEKAVEWYLKAAEKNNSKAMRKLASMYMNGQGVPKNKKLAIDWNTKATIAEAK